MNFIESVKYCLKNYATFSGRAPRSQFWWFFLAMILANIVTGVLDASLFTSIDPATGKSGGFSPLSNIFSLLLFIPNIAVSARRLHDLNKSGWWQLIGIIPIVGWVIMLIWLCTKGTVGDNRFGPDPLAGKSSSA